MAGRLFEVAALRGRRAYWGLTSKVKNYGLPEAPGYSDSVVELLACVRTDLDPFTDGEIACLENQGYARANVAALRWLKNLLPPQPAQFDWPHLDYIREEAAAEALADSENHGIFQDIWESVKHRASDWF